MRIRLVLTLVIIPWLLFGCDFTTDSQDSLEDAILIQTDQESYQLIRGAAIFSTPMRVTIVNNSALSIFLVRVCGDGARPFRQLVRTRDTATRIEIGQITCSRGLGTNDDPIEVAAHSTYRDEFSLKSLESGAAIPRITMDMRTGHFKFKYQIKRRDLASTRTEYIDTDGNVGLSNEFQILRP